MRQVWEVAGGGHSFDVDGISYCIKYNTICICGKLGNSCSVYFVCILEEVKNNDYGWDPIMYRKWFKNVKWWRKVWYDVSTLNAI